LASAAANRIAVGLLLASTISALARNAFMISGDHCLIATPDALASQRQTLRVRRAAQHPGDVGAAGGFDLRPQCG
jgi:hypothetical protein